MRRSTTSARKIIYAGIDFHRKYSVISLGNSKGKEIERIKLLNNKNEVVKFCKSYPKLNCAIESTRGFQWFVELLQEQGLTVKVAHPYKVKLIAASRKKNDKIDSRILMELLAMGFLPTSYQPTEEERLIRDRLKWRVFLVRAATRIKARIRCLVANENLEVGLRTLSGANSYKKLLGIKLSSASRQEILKSQIHLLKYHEEQIAEEDLWVRSKAKELPAAHLLKTVPGIGDFIALVILSELGDISRFKRAKSVVNYAGLVPSVYSSADTHRTGRLTKQGSRMLRWVMVQAAWVAIGRDQELKFHFVSVSQKQGRLGAIMSVARKLLKVAYRVLRDEQPYDSKLIGVK